EYQLEQISNLTDKILFLEQYNSPEQHNKENFNLTSLLRWHIKGLKALTDEKKISVNADIAENVYINSVKDYIRRIINILTDNAVKYTPENGIITIKLEDLKNKIFMSIENTGEGIDAEYIDRIFDRFYRINKTENKKKSGNGLGLTIAKSILEKIGGEISVESIRGKRTTFYISLPKK
ncbi:MAG TPA: HAMP domain-containing sensor histidine kinase, partial [Halanaerobiales bacterium]|nr:HAMP domain-containing sensor histidine kinase [Halanaerobiales bacterium]